MYGHYWHLKHTMTSMDVVFSRIYVQQAQVNWPLMRICFVLFLRFILGCTWILSIYHKYTEYLIINTYQGFVTISIFIYNHMSTRGIRHLNGQVEWTSRRYVNIFHLKFVITVFVEALTYIHISPSASTVLSTHLCLFLFFFSFLNNDFWLRLR